VLDDELEQNEEYPQDLENWFKAEMTKKRKTTMEDRKQHERAENRTQIRRIHKRNDEKGAGGNLQT
jgi:hypothetical protein